MIHATSSEKHTQYEAWGRGKQHPEARLHHKRKLLSLQSSVVQFMIITILCDFRQTCFYAFTHVYSPEAGVDNPYEKKVIVT